jgi:O-antigen/teichoic acid export membrane protein
MAKAIEGLANRVRTGMAWSMFESWSVQLLQFVTFMVVARYVDPASLGIVAMALLVGQFFQIAVLSSLGNPLVSAGRDDAALEGTTFWIALAVGTAMMLITVTCAEIAGHWLEQPGLAWTLGWLSLVNFLNAVNVMPQAILSRSLRMGSLAMRSTVSTAVGGAIGISMAIAGYGLDALIAQNVAFALVATVILWAAIPKPQSMLFVREKAREILFYARHGAATGIANFFNANADVLFVGVALGASAAGIYTVGKRALLAANLLLARAISRVALPAFSQIKDDRPRLAVAFLKMVSATSLVTTPAFVGMALVADEFIDMAFGPHWADAADIMRPLCLFGALQAIGIYNQSLMLALKKPHWQTALALLYALANISLVFVAMNEGPAAVAIAFTMRAYIFYPLSVFAVICLLPIGWRAYGQSISLSIVATAVMAAAILLVTPMLPAMNAPLALSIKICLGILSYAAVLITMGQSQMAEMIQFGLGKRPL